MGTPASITVVIPTLNEQASIRASVSSALAGADEVIAVDGGSTDTTVAVAGAAGARVLSGPRGRAAQMETGAAAASGDWLVFLHADTCIWRTALVNGCVMALAALGWPRESLARIYGGRGA